MMKQTRRTLLRNTGAFAAALVASPVAFAEERLKVAFAYASPIGDHGWSFAHEQGRQEAVRRFGDAIDATFIEHLPEGPVSAPVLRELALDGNRIIFTTAFGYEDQALSVARDFPGVRFEQATGSYRADNFATYNARFHEGRAICGTIAGHMSEAGMAGYIASFPRFEVVMGINAFTLAARRVNPEFRTRVIWVSSWSNSERDAAAARTLMDQGADIISQHTDSLSPLQLCEERGCMGFGQSWDMSAYAPTAHLTTIANHWGVYYADRIGRVMEDSWSPGNAWWGLKEGMIKMTPYNRRIPANVRQAADAVMEGQISGATPVFAGPITDRTGRRRVGDRTLSDDELRAMDWYVEGVEG